LDLDGSSQNLESILPGAGETSLGCLPVDDIPDVINISSLSVEILYPY